MHSMETKPDFTICSVYHSRDNKKLLELNWDLAQKLNPGFRWTWVVTDNAPRELRERIDAKKFQVIPGVRHEEMPDYVRPWMRGSYHHTLAIHKSLPYIKTRFALFLDSDFYIVRPEWMREITHYMQERGLAFFGVPWHPRHVKKYRYFPAIHSFFVDLAQVDLDNLNFIPQYEELLKPSRATKVVQKLGRAFLRFVPEDRRGIGTSRDSGYAIFRKYARSAKFECPQPVVRREDFSEYPRAFSRRNRMLEQFLPDRFCILPKRKGYYTETGFSDLGYFDAAKNGWEEFVWRGAPFAFHLRGMYRLSGASEASFKHIEAVLGNFVKQF